MTDVWSLGAKGVVKNSLNPGCIAEHTGVWMRTFGNMHRKMKSENTDGIISACEQFLGGWGLSISNSSPINVTVHT